MIQFNGHISSVLAGMQDSGETNIALLKYGARAFASSSHSASCPDNVISDTTSGVPDKWDSSGEEKTQHWLALDLGHPRKVHKIVVKHAGVMENQQYNTRDFQLQRASSMDGPWKDIVEPILGNTESITTHEFEPLEARYIRIYITKPSQKDEPDVYHHARIFNIEVYTREPIQQLVNIALPQYGATAIASSSNDKRYAYKAINNIYSHQYADKWCCGDFNRGIPPWLVVDVGQQREICKIIVKHAGTIERQDYTTSDFHLQYPSVENGTWKDIIPPVRGNVDAVTVHDFAPLETQYIRLYIIKPSQKEQPSLYARIFGIEAYTTQSVEPAPPKITYLKVSPIEITTPDSEHFVELEVQNSGRQIQAEVQMEIPLLSKQTSTSITVPSGVSTHKIKVPTIKEDVPVKVSLLVDGSACAEAAGTIRFTPEINLTTKHFTIKCSEALYKANQAKFQEFMHYADACYEATGDILGVTPKTPIPLLIDENIETVPGGWSDGRQIEMSMSCFVDDGSWKWFTFTNLPHELIHYILLGYVKCGFPPWFVEPPASYLNIEIIARAAAAIGRQDLVERARKAERDATKWKKHVEKGAQYIWLERAPEEDRDNSTGRTARYMLKRLRDEHGLDIFKKFIHLLLADKVDMRGVDIHGKNRLMIEYMSKAAGTDLKVFFAQFGFPVELYE